MTNIFMQGLHTVSLRILNIRLIFSWPCPGASGGADYQRESQFPELVDHHPLFGLL